MYRNGSTIMIETDETMKEEMSMRLAMSSKMPSLSLLETNRVSSFEITSERSRVALGMKRHD